jgi:formylmethanofuran dehydrogenase subunit E
MPQQELLRVESVTLTARFGQLLGPPGGRVTCAVCGEDVLNGRAVATPTGPVCRGCVGEPYYRRAEAGGSDRPRTARRA